MCISFFSIDSDCKPDQYKFVLVFNRDEYYNRNTAEANFWSDCSHIIAGRDLSSNTRGTWLGVSTYGKIGALLNISDKPLIDGSPSRGALVSDFLSNNVSPIAYAKSLVTDGKVYNGYNLLLFDVVNDENKAILHTNANEGKFHETIELKDGIYGVSNSRYCTPYKKVENNKALFADVLKKFNSTGVKDALIRELLKMMKSEVKHYPDDVMYKTKKFMMKESYIEYLSQIFVTMPREVMYGTRTQTIILVDKNNTAEFHEFTKKNPTEVEHEEWSHTNFTFSFNNR